MPKAIDMALRRTIVEARLRGKTLTELAAKYQVSYATVQSLCAKYSEQGEAGLKPRYDRCGKQRPDGKDFVFRAVRCFRHWHPLWGAEKIRTEISLLRPGLQLPATRTIQQWFHYTGQAKKRDRTPRNTPSWANSVHEGWQVDAKEEMRTRDGVKNCWLNIMDEYSGAIIDPPVFPPQDDLPGTTQDHSESIDHHL